MLRRRKRKPGPPATRRKTWQAKQRTVRKRRTHPLPPNRAVLARTLRLHEERLKALPNVHHLGISQKIKDGRRRAQASITVYVTKKAHVPPSQRVPKRLRLAVRNSRRTIATDVCELPGVPKLFAVRGGAQILSADNETGTAGIVFRHRRRDYCITNAHVISDPEMNGAFTVTLPAPVGGSGEVVLRDELSAGTEITSDAALIRLDTPVDSWQFYNSNGIMDGFVDNPAIGLNCLYVARNGADHKTFQCRMSAVVAGTAQIEVDGTFLTYSGFFRFEVLNGSPKGGHSGALVYLDQGANLKGVGLAFGGIEGSEIWAFPARRCFDKMMTFFQS